MGTARLVIRFATEDVRDFQRIADFGHYPAIANRQPHPLPGACDVEFDATFDLGLTGVMDPIAGRVPRRITCSVLAALFGEVTILPHGRTAPVNPTGASTP